MDRTNICKNIIQSIKDYIMDPVKLCSPTLGSDPMKYR